MNLILLDAIKGRYEFPELRRLALEQYKYWHPETVIIEAKASGLPLTYELRQMDIPVSNFTPSKGNDKHVKSKCMRTLFESGMIWAPDQKFAEEVIEECAAFPFGDHDDLVDSMTQAVMRFRQGRIFNPSRRTIFYPKNIPEKMSIINVLATKFFTKGKSVKDAIKYFHTINGRPPSGIETIRIKNAFMEQNRQSNVIDITSRIKDDWWKQRSGFKRQHPEVTKKIKGSDDLVKWFEETTGEKVDTDTYSALLERHGKELEGIDKNQGMGFYREMGDMMKRHSREELEFKYDEMFNKILEKAKRIDADPKVLLEAELGKKLTGKETTTQLLDILKIDLRRHPAVV